MKSVKKQIIAAIHQISNDVIIFGSSFLYNKRQKYQELTK